MVKLQSPAPWGWKGIPFGSTEPPYSASNRHRGQDWGWYNADIKGSRRVVSPVEGTVTAVYAGGGYNNGWGNRVEVTINNAVYSALNHLETGTIAVSVGQYVIPGTYIGQMGATGNTGGQPHLHEELWVNGTRVDPELYRSNDIPGTAGEEEEEDMTPEQDALLRNIAGFLYGGGTSVSDPNYTGMPGTIYNLLKSPVNRTVDGKAQKIPQIQDNADTNTMVRQLLARPQVTITDEQIKVIAGAIAAQLGKPEVEIDYAKIAQVVRAKFAEEPLG